MTITNPADIPDLALMYDADDPDCVVLSGVRATQLRDLSGNDRHTSVIANGPQHGQFSLNGKNLLMWSVATTYAGNWALPDFVSGYTEVTAYCLSFGNAVNLNGHFVYLGRQSGLQNHFGSPNGDWIDAFGGSQRVSSFSPYGLPKSNQWNRSVLMRSGDTIYGRINGTLSSTVASTRNFSSAPTFPDLWSGFIAEFGIYSRALAPSEQIDLSDYLTTKWLTAPTGGGGAAVHPLGGA